MQKETAVKAAQLLENIDALDRLKDELSVVEAFDDLPKEIYNAVISLVDSYLNMMNKDLEDL